MSNTWAKMSLSTALAVLGSAANRVAVPFCVMCVLMCADYFTGLAKSWQLGTLSSREGLKGLVKKLSYGLAIVASAGVDFIIGYCCETAKGGSCYRPIFLLLIISWFSVNECISILENLNEAGVPLPAFLLKAAKKLKKEVESKGEEEEVDKHDGNDRDE